jgi:hypothetical protein
LPKSLTLGAKHDGKEQKVEGLEQWAFLALVGFSARSTLPGPEWRFCKVVSTPNTGTCPFIVVIDLKGTRRLVGRA